ncbi:hypothetical protein BN59_03311 [Legionella massiliensis]|uniref:Uncharacterized protein n=1 Tax=Legionella massiliensis TaxID=1034943 RepID=A0A078L1D2_9GAMM|nr:hypothetical protein [Legionella massiliensis]CDZ78996.1 hypothetical protein BN59_03311 [Legionella massiliensis]CEE14734.1 hypothetical protein BN1094_03311 [Legionella massiliensis]
MPKKYPDEIAYYEQNITTKISMKNEFRTERKAMRLLPSNDPEQKYLDKEKQDLYEIKFSEEEGIFLDYEGNVLSGKYNFIITCEENPRIICHPTMNHSFLANGKKVLAAGNLFFQFDTLVTITNNSGHYRPTDEEMLPVIKALDVATEGSLLRYISHCTNEPLVYPVIELVDAEHFSDVLPLDDQEVINPVSGQREDTGYDSLISDESKNQSFNRKLPLETIIKYQKIVEGNYSFFSTNEKPDDLADGIANIHLKPLSVSFG